MEIIIDNGIMKQVIRDGPYTRTEVIGGAYTTGDVIDKMTGEYRNKAEIVAENSQSPIVDNVGEFKVSADTDRFVNDLFTQSFNWYPDGSGKWNNVDEITKAWVDKSGGKFKVMFGYVSQDEAFDIATRPEYLRGRM